MKRTRSSNYRHTVIIQKNTAAQGTTGQVTKSWANFLTRTASVEPLQGRELFAAQQIKSETTVKIKMRYDTGLDVVDVRDYQITFNSKIYDIHNVADQYEGHREVWFMCGIRNE